MDLNRNSKNGSVPEEYRLPSSPQTVVNKWITIGVLAVIWLCLVISLLQK